LDATLKGMVFSLYAMEVYERNRGVAPLILNLGARWEVSGQFRSGCSTLANNHGTRPIGGWVSHRAVMRSLGGGVLCVLAAFSPALGFRRIIVPFIPCW